MYSLGAIDAGITTGGIGIPSTGGGVGIPPLLIERLPKLDKTGGGGIPANNAGSGTAIFSGGIGILVPNSGVASFDGAPVIETLERIRLSSNQNIGEGDSNFDEKVLKKCSTDQRFIRKRNTAYKIGTLVIKEQ